MDGKCINNKDGGDNQFPSEKRYETLPDIPISIPETPPEKTNENPPDIPNSIPETPSEETNEKLPDIPLNIPGFNRIQHSKSKKVRIFWGLFLLGTLCVFSVQTGRLVKMYNIQPKALEIKLLRNGALFPWVTFCSLEPFDKYYVRQFWRLQDKEVIDIEGLDSEVPVPNEKELVAILDEIGYTDKVVHFLRNLTDTDGLSQKEKEELNENILIFSNTVHTQEILAIKLGIEKAKEYGLLKQEVVSLCQFNKKTCDLEKDFHTIFDAYFYNCFTFKPPGGSKMMMHREQEERNIETGLSLITFNGNGYQMPSLGYMFKSEIFDPLIDSAGLRVVIHQPGTKPYPHLDGINIAPGSAVTIRLKETLTESDALEDMENIGKYNYTEEICIDICIQEMIMEECHCVDVRFNILENNEFPLCGYDINMTEVYFNCLNQSTLEYSKECSEDITQSAQKLACPTHMYMEGSDTCKFKCPMAKKRISYEQQNSFYPWPRGAQHTTDVIPYTSFDRLFTSGDFRQHFREEKWPLIESLYFNDTDVPYEQFPPSKQREYLKMFSLINIYFSDINVFLTYEYYAYGSTQFISDLGGQMGLWLGVCLSSIFEIIECIVAISIFSFAKAKLFFLQKFDLETNTESKEVGVENGEYTQDELDFNYANSDTVRRPSTIHLNSSSQKSYL